jgi:heme/copper-type cytochrome/quinol oxidase subunit 1
MLNYISNLLNSVLYSIFSFDKLFNKNFRNNTNNTNVTYSFYFKNFFAHSKTLFVNIWSLQKVNYLTLHTASAGRWIKIRASYLLNSWVYTTNHKRIAINYFNFVLVSGTAGMSLATVIRMEFAYPGVGILAGDSIQYLCIATAHGVIMVFFMVMPAIFGAFGNFLLPTQLGVHDVAFPRLNSAAFWFLPGGLIMLCQLVCVDRRYQRMNCFNIREIQGILKRKFFTDLVNTSDNRLAMDSTLIGIRHRNNMSNINLYDQSLFYNFDLTNTSKYKSFFMGPSESHSYLSNSFVNNKLTKFISHTHQYIGLSLPSFSLNQILKDLMFFLYSPITHSLLTVFSSFSYIKYTMLTTLFIPNMSLSNLLKLNTNPSTDLNSLGTVDTLSDMSYISTTQNYNDFSNLTKFNFADNSSSWRFNRYSYPLISYDYKSGNYLSIWDQLYPALTLSFIEVARGIRKAPWFFSDQYTDLLKTNYSNFLSKFTNQLNLKLADVDNWNSVYVSPLNSFLSIFFNFTKNDTFVNLRWISINTLDQKLYTMFNSSSIQQRILANWRSLKFTREAWRCKLLVSRHQNTLYKRFVSEENLVYSIERNTKDLLPGWAMVTPFSARTRFTAVGKTDVGLMGVFLALNASIISSANFLVTYRYLSTLNNRKMRDARSFFSEALITASWMMIAANPMLAIAILMLLSDRHWQTSFFDYSGGGDTVLFQHMFWFFGHPEVYVIMLPIFGFTNTIMSFYFRKRISARASLLYSMYTIAFLGFFVWGHHMYMVGLSHTTRMLFSTLTVMISVPAATKLMHWCVTIVNSSFVMEIPLLYSLTFTFFFVSGGISGMAVAHTGMDVLFHDTFYVIGHFHIMFGGSAMLGIYAAFYFYFPVLYGVKFSRIYAYIHYTYYTLGQLLIILPMLWLGYCGQPRRILDYPSSLGGWHSISSAGHLITVAAVLSFFIMIYDSVRQAKPTIRNNFGVTRFNTRLNFYFFEISRLSFIQQKNFYNFRQKKLYSNGSRRNSIYIADLDSTLFSYQFIK